MRRTTACLLSASLFLILAAPAQSGGYSIYEQSAKASAQAGAWVARADDAAANWYNPAALVRLGSQVQVGGNLIPIGDSTHLELLPTGERIDAVGNDGTPLHFYYNRPISDRLAWGLGVNTPYGLITEWSERPVALSAARSELVTIVVNPNVAFDLGGGWSAAVGLNYLHADVKEFSRELALAELVELGNCVSAGPACLAGLPPVPPTFGRVDLTGDGDDWGYNVALHHMGDGWSFGATYRDGLETAIDGQVEFGDIPEVLGATGPFGNLFPDGSGSTDVPFPAQAAVGVAVFPGEGWELEIDLSWARWSSFKELVLDFHTETSIPPVSLTIPMGPTVVLVPSEQPVVADETQVENWESTTTIRMGLAHDLSDRHQLRFGAMREQNPIPASTLRPSIPDSDRTGVTAGYGWSGKRNRVDVYYMALFFDDRLAFGAHGDDSVVNGEYINFGNLFGLTWSWDFRE